jgi:glycosyltransferase involved in cell wall biosynthesis
MLGWEFAPFIAGGLGVVCKALSTSLAKNYSIQITYVLPRIPSSSSFNHKGIRFKNAKVDKFNKIKFIEIESLGVSPYLSEQNLKKFLSDVYKSKGKLDDKTKEQIYNMNLMNEVSAYAYQTAKLAKNDNYDVIHNHDWMTAPAAVKAKKSIDKPMVMHIHSTEYERTLGNPNQDVFDIERQGMENADQIIAVSKKTKERIIANYGITADKIKVVHNAIEKIESKYGPIAKSIHKDDQVVLFLARLTAMKGANYLLDAAPHVLEHLPKTKFLFVGQGELLEQLVEKSVELGISHKVTFTGFLPHDQVDRAYRFADVFILPSVAEPFGVTPLEAIKNGTPVILSKQSGVSEVLQNVLKVDFWDTRELANKIIAVLKHGVLTDELVNNSKRDLEMLDWDAQSKKVLDLYNQLTQKYSFEVA